MKCPSVLALIFLFTGICGAAEPKLIVKPGSRKTLVNPACSHCLDEAKRRAGVLRYQMQAKYAPVDLPSAPHPDSLATRPATDPRLPPEEVVIGLALGAIARAYPIALLNTNPVVRDQIGDQPLAVLWYQPTKTAAIYAPQIEQGDVPPRLRLEFKNQIASAPFMDRETFSHWTIEGRSVEGPLKGKTLRSLPGVQCKWYAWAAEYPDTEIYSPVKHPAPEPAQPIAAKLIQGIRLNWDQLARTAARIIRIDPKNHSLTVWAESDQQEHTVSLSPHSEFYAHGSWGTLEDFRPSQVVFLIATRDEQKHWIDLHAIADEISIQAMNSPCRLESSAENELVFKHPNGKKGSIRLEVDPASTKITVAARPLQPGQSYYFNSAQTGPSRRAIALLDQASFDRLRRDRARRHHKAIAKNGIEATVLEVDPAQGKLVLLVRRPDAWTARTLRTQSNLSIKYNKDSSADLRLKEVRPDYSRVRLVLAGSHSFLSELAPGQPVQVLGRFSQTKSGLRPPDLGRFRERQDRIDYFLSSIYCCCGMRGDNCAGHWNTLAACQLHGCGMPDLTTRLIGDWIDRGWNDQKILQKLIERHGDIILRQHHTIPLLY